MIVGAVGAAGNRDRIAMRRWRGRSAFLAAPLSIILLAVPLLGAALRASAGQRRSPAAQPPSHELSSIFTPEIQLWKNALTEWADEAEVDPNLAAAVMQVESCGNPFARSAAGAIGLFQVMPYHFAGTEDPLAPSTNARRALEYLKKSLAAADGDPRLALAGYNGGIGVISEAEWGWPAETARYAYWAGGIYSDAINGATTSGSLAEWLAAGGTSLCESARRVFDSG